MNRLVRDSWPLVAVVALSTILALQIPRKALFFTPVTVSESEPFASFVMYDAKSYESVIQRVRMSWQMRGGAENAYESRVDALDFAEDVPNLPPLGLPSEFSSQRLDEPVTVAFTSLLPPSVADRSVLVPVATPPDDGQEARDLRVDLLSLPESLQSNE